MSVSGEAPVIGTQPENVDVERGGNATLSVVATGEGLSYQWFGPDGEIKGATASTLRITNAGPDDAGDYRVRITTVNGGIVDSDTVSLSVGPAIDVQPSDVNAAEAGGTATFTVEASGEGLLSYQWFGPGGDALTDVDGDIEGSNSSTLQIINVESGDAGDYTVVVTNSAGSVISDAATLSIGEAPVIGTQPENVDVERGGNATLSVVATGEGLSYQWFGPDGEIEGATASTLRITNAGPDDAGDYRVRITTVNGGIVDSDTVSLSVGPAIDVQPSDVNAEAGGTATFTVGASGEGLSYQWFGPDGESLFNSDGAIEGATTSTLRVINTGPKDAGGYRVRVTSPSGRIIDSDVASLNFEPLLRLNCDISADFFSAECSSSLDGIISLVYSCSLNNQPPTICGPGPRFPFPIDRLDPGSFSYRITAMSPGGQVSSSDVSFAVQAPPVDCVEIADAGRSNEIILSCDGFVQSSNCTFDDGSPAIEPCDINSITINIFTDSPGPRVLIIEYTDVNGLVGIFEYNFTGRVRPRAVVGFKTRDLRILAEGQSIFLMVDGRGFSYGSIPVEVTPLPCSDYPGDLSALFSDIPTASITLDDLIGASPRTVSLPPLGSGQISILFSSSIDNLDEEEECLVFILSVDETQLDPRDQGQVDIDSDVALGRLQDVQFTCTQNQSVASILVDCDGNFVFDEITCLFDGATPEPCNLPLVVNQLEYLPGRHTLTIVVRSAGIEIITDIDFDGQTVDSLPRLIIEFGVLGQTGTRVLNIQETDDSPQGAVVNVQGPSFRPLPYRITYLTYDEFEAQSRNRNLDKIFPARPRAASADDFNATVSQSGIIPGHFAPAIIDDSSAELTEGFIALLDLERQLIDPRDYNRIQFLNDIILVTIEDNDSIECSSRVTENAAIVSCKGIDGQPDNGDIFCSLDFLPAEPCTFPYTIPTSEVPTGRHDVIIFRVVQGRQENIGGTSFTVQQLEVYFHGDTPVVNVDRLLARFQANRPNVTFECHLTHLDIYKEDCSSGVFERSGIPHGDYTLRVIARDPARPLDGRTIVRNRIWVHGDNVFCVTGSQNRALTINGNNATVEFYSTGVVTGYKCVLDHSEIIYNCASPYTIQGLTQGRHHFKVIPLGCERQYRANTMQFTII
ncbi:uncharacterized protein LOC135342430 isoform X2 [Halichondria panicea]|uniref:uncharacterized protein LOC135342430 isoform X2 n=1 Tax=Halichondria panicea TaxID=6063 RepID=UPI00312B5AD6